MGRRVVVVVGEVMMAVGEVLSLCQSRAEFEGKSGRRVRCSEWEAGC